MPRTRTINDKEVLDATINFVVENGIEKLTLASLGRQVDLSPSTLVQRFGTKQQLLVSATIHGLEDAESVMRITKGQHHSPLKTIVVALTAMANVVGSVKEFANGQAFFQLALTNPSIYVVLRASARSTREDIEQLLSEAMDSGELKPCDIEDLALTLQATYEGAIITWVTYQEDTLEAWVERRLKAVIEPYKL